MRKICFVFFFSFFVFFFSWCQEVFDIKVSNSCDKIRKSVPVVLPLEEHGTVRSAVVYCMGEEVPCQLDDLDNDGSFDELCFLTDLESNQEKTFSVNLFPQGEAREYTPLVYAEMLLTNKKVKSENKQDLYISSLTVDNGVNPYWMLHHHGPAFENEMVAYRIYFDYRQTVDIYGKYHLGLELKDTQFYPDASQKSSGYGDDVLWVGETFGVGALRGWDGSKPAMINDVKNRTLSILSRGPLRTIVEVVDRGWIVPGTQNLSIDMITRYTLYAKRRDCDVKVLFSPSASSMSFSTGLINIKGSEEFSDGDGLRGCWGTDWPVSEKDSVGHKRETVGLGICLPADCILKELSGDKDNYPFIIGNVDKELHYGITFCSDNEEFGFHSSQEWFSYLKEWKAELANPVIITY